MTKHHWTPDAVHELVKDWPDLARASIGWAPESREWVQLDATYLSPDLAAAAHVASGLEWLAGRRLGPCLEIYRTDGHYGVSWDDGDVFPGPTLLHAVSAAIMAAANP